MIQSYKTSDFYSERKVTLQINKHIFTDINAIASLLLFVNTTKCNLKFEERCVEMCIFLCENKFEKCVKG